VKFGRPEVDEIARCLLDQKNSARSVALASAPIEPKICQGQRRTMYSQCPKCHPNQFTSGGVIAERVNTVQTRHKVFSILSEIIASSPSKNLNILHSQTQSYSWIILNTLGSTENARHETTAQWKMQKWKLRETKTVAQCCRGWKMRHKPLWTAKRTLSTTLVNFSVVVSSLQCTLTVTHIKTNEIIRLRGNTTI